MAILQWYFLKIHFKLVSRSYQHLQDNLEEFGLRLSPDTSSVVVFHLFFGH